MSNQASVLTWDEHLFQSLMSDFSLISVMRMPDQIWSSSPFCPPEYWGSTRLSIIGKLGSDTDLWSVLRFRVSVRGFQPPEYGWQNSELSLQIILNWVISKITLGNSWLYKILIYPGKQFKVLTSLFFTNWFTNYCMNCGDYVCLLATC